MAVPYLVTKDAVAADYVMLALNVAFLALAVVAVAMGLAAERALSLRRAWLLPTLSFLALLANLVSHLPVRLGDLPALAVFLVALGLGMDTAATPPSTRRLSGRYAAAGACCAGATLLKLNYFVHALVLLGLLLLLDRNQTSDRRRLTSAAAFLAGFSPVTLQFVDVFLHSARVALFDDAYVRPFHHPERGLAIEAVFYTLPATGAYTVRPAEPIGFASLVALRLYRGLFGFEWAVYRGPAHSGPVWPLTTTDMVWAWGLVLLWATLTGAAMWRGPRGLGLLAAVGAAVALTTAVLGHTELRYYALPRVAWWLTAACGGLWMLSRSRSADSP